jgi:hypothetical protein
LRCTVGCQGDHSKALFGGLFAIEIGATSFLLLVLYVVLTAPDLTQMTVFPCAKCL